MRTRVPIINGSLMLTLFVTLIFASKKPAHRHNAKRTGTDLSVTVYKKSDYSGALYTGESAQLHVKVSTDENIVVSDTTFNSEYLHQYPSLNDAVQQNLEIKDIHQKFKYLVVKYDVTYDSGGNKLQIPNSVTIERHGSKDVLISI